MNDIPIEEIEKIDEKVCKHGYGSYTVVIHQGKRIECNETLKHKPQDFNK